MANKDVLDVGTKVTVGDFMATHWEDEEFEKYGVHNLGMAMAPKLVVDTISGKAANVTAYDEIIYEGKSRWTVINKKEN